MFFSSFCLQTSSFVCTVCILHLVCLALNLCLSRNNVLCCCMHQNFPLGTNNVHIIYFHRMGPHPKHKMPYHYYKPRGPDECLTYLQNERGRMGNHHRFITEKQVFARWAKLYNITFSHPRW